MIWGMPTDPTAGVPVTGIPDGRALEAAGPQATRLIPDGITRAGHWRSTAPCQIPARRELRSYPACLER